MKHKYIEKSKDKLLVMLHGTGGDETSLVEIADYIDNESSILGLRGNVNEMGLNRFFRRIKSNVFDIDNLKIETKNLKLFLEEFSQKTSIPLKKMVLVGYSNGANIISSLLFQYFVEFKGVALLHGMVPIKDIEFKSQKNQKIFISASKNDYIVPSKESIDLIELYKKNHAIVNDFWFEYGHILSQEELLKLKEWYVHL